MQKHALHSIPFFEQLQSTSKRILLAGMGGGFDIYNGIPLYFSLKEQGYSVTLANLSFTTLFETTSRPVSAGCYQISQHSEEVSGRNYFPELYLKQWLTDQGETVDVYALERDGVKPLLDSYNYLIKEHAIDTVLLVDGGTDCLMFGDEQGLGSPQEDICSLAAAYQSNVDHKYLVSIGFGIDHFHGVSHYRFLENVAKLQRDGGYLGLFELSMLMKEANKFQEAVTYANKKMQKAHSIVANSIVSALEGQYGDYHKTKRTRGSELYINPLMPIYWSFKLDAVVENLKYYDQIKNCRNMKEFNYGLSDYRVRLEKERESRQLPI